MEQLWLVKVSYKVSSLFMWGKVVTSYHTGVFLLWWDIT